MGPPPDRFIPVSPEEVTPQWATAALRAAGVLHGGRVTAVELEPLNSGGQGLTGAVTRLRLSAEGSADVPDTVVAKFASTNRETRAVMENFDSYAREIRFYQRYAHRMPVPTPQYFGGDYDPGSATGPGPMGSRLVDVLPSPAKLWISRNVTSFMRPTNRRYALLIEDLGSVGQVFSLVSPPTIDQLGVAVDLLASIHAQFWGDPSLASDDTFSLLGTSTPGLFKTVAQKRCIPIACDRYSWFGEAQEALFVDACARLRADVALLNQPMTLVHGDARSDNIMFRDHGGAVLFDWALTANANPGWDVGYLLSSALDPEQASAKIDLVDRYLETLATLGVDTDRTEFRAAVDAAYRVVGIFQLLSIAIFDGRLEGTGDEMADHWLPRVAAGLSTGWER